MALSSEFREYVLELLEPIGPVQSKRLFGGAGLYRDDTIFAVLSDDTLFLKVDDQNRGLFEDEGMTAFNPSKDGKRFIRSYYECPSRLLEDPNDLCEWAKLSWEAGRRIEAAKPKKKKPTKAKS